MKYIPYFGVPIALLVAFSGPTYGQGKIDIEPTPVIYRLCKIHANFPADASVVAITVEDICAQELFQLLSHESVQTVVSKDGVVAKVGEGIVCERKPAPREDFAYHCEQVMNREGGLLPGASMTPDGYLDDPIPYILITINGSTASKLYRFLSHVIPKVKASESKF